jgi:hypothetical protein
MKRFLIVVFAAYVVAFGALGCSKPVVEQQSEHAHDQGHDHAHEQGHAHDHDDPSNHDSAHHDDHEHGNGPHGGVIADWGGGVFHVEFTVNHDKKECTVYVLGDDAKTPAPIDAKRIQVSIVEPLFDIDLNAQPLDGESNGRSSRFSAQHDNFGIVREFAGTIVGVADGTPYASEFKE